MTVQDEILIRVGMDASQLANATMTAIRAQKEAAAQYEMAWKTAINATTTAQAQAAQKQMAMARQQFQFWQQQAQGATMQGGYIFNAKGQVIGKEKTAGSWIKNRANEKMATSYPEGWSSAGGGVVGNVVGNMAMGGGIRDSLEMAGGMALGGLAQAATVKAIGHTASSTIVRETLVLIREALRGTFTRMAGSATILLNALGATAATWISSIPVIGTGVAGIIGNIFMRRQLSSGFGAFSGGGFQDKHGYNWALGRTGEKIGKDLGGYLKMLHNTGQIGGDEYQDLMKRLHAGGLDNETFVQRRLMQHGPFMKAVDIAQAGKLDEIGFKSSLVGKSSQQTWLAYEQRIYKTMNEMRSLDKDSTAYRQKQLELSKLQYEQAEATKRATKEQAEADKKSAEEKTKQAKAAKELADKQDTYNLKMEQLQNRLKSENARADIMGSAGDLAGNWIPSVDELASGNGFMTRANNYKRWLAWASPFKSTARDYIRSQLALARDVSFGAGADTIAGDETAVRQLRSKLAQAGFLPPDQKLDMVNDSIKTTTDAVNTLTAKATRDGIVIKAGE